MGVEGQAVGGRYVPRRSLGCGGMGEVLLAHDTRTGRDVALKMLARPDDLQALLRLKAEFRTLSELHHPNLVRVYGLHEADGDWFIVMEYVRGRDLRLALGLAADVGAALPMEATLPAPDTSAPVQPRRTQEVLPAVSSVCSAALQIVYALTYLHEHGLVHRDIKPANVLVTDEGRVVLVDFGLARQVRVPLGVVSETRAGTPLYMSPEHLSGVGLGPASDLYSLGIVLYQLLTGRAPHEGEGLQALVARATSRPPAPSTLRPSLSAELDQLLIGMLEPDPAARPTADRVVETLRRHLPLQPQSERPPRGWLSPWQGRHGEIAQLEALLDETGEVRPRLIRVVGPSGIGKTRLVEETLIRRRARRPDLLVLRGRCHPEASIPYKALDPLVDELVRWLRNLDHGARRAVVPPAIGALTRVFPVLNRIPVIAELSVLSSQPAGDPISQRTEALSAFVRLVVNLAATRPLVVWIDDLQWADPDSLEALWYLVRDEALADVPIVVTERPGEPVENAAELLALPEQRGRIRAFHVEPLGDEDARAVVRAVGGEAFATDDAAVHALLAEARGSPFVLIELARHRGSGEHKQRVQSMLSARLDALGAPARAVFEALSVCGRPCDTLALRRAVISDADTGEVIERLEHAGLVRRAESTSADLVEPVHDRFREAALAELPEATVRQLHAQLATALEAVGGDHPEDLADHWVTAGEWTRARPYVEEAARRALDAYAFRRAADWLRHRLRIGAALQEPPQDLEPWREQLAGALIGMGHATEAAAILSEIASQRSGDDKLDLQRRAADQYLFAGHVDQALDLYREVLRRAGLSLPHTSLGALAALLAARARVRLGSLLQSSPAARAPTADQALRIDLAYSVAMGLSIVDLPRGTGIQSHHIRWAMRWGDDARRARGLAAEAGYRATSGAVGRAHARALLDEAWALLDEDAPAELRGFVETMEAAVAWSACQWGACAAHAHTAVLTLTRRCRDRTYQLNLARSLLFDSAIWRGEFASLSSSVEELVEDARRRGDLYAETMFAMRFGCTAALAADDTARASAWLCHLDGWAQTGFHTHHLVALHHACDLALYLGRPAEALERLNRTWPAARRALYMHSQPHRTKLRDLRARVHLAAAAADANRRGRFMTRARREIRALRHEGTRFATVLAEVLELCAAHLDTGTVSADASRRVVEASSQLELAFHANILDWTRQPEAARRWFESQRVARPDRWLRVYLPGMAPASPDG